MWSIPPAEPPHQVMEVGSLRNAATRSSMDLNGDPDDTTTTIVSFVSRASGCASVRWKGLFWAIVAHTVEPPINSAR